MPSTSLPNLRSLDDLVYLGDSQETHTSIASVVVQLPANVLAFVKEHCTFISVGDVLAGITLPTYALLGRGGGFKNRWLIVLDGREPADQIHATIAHEIAHAWLRHDRYERYRKMPEDAEVQAATLARDWGFTGLAADPEFHRDR